MCVGGGWKRVAVYVPACMGAHSCVSQSKGSLCVCWRVPTGSGIGGGGGMGEGGGGGGFLVEFIHSSQNKKLKNTRGFQAKNRRKKGP